jgi:photosystem II stability/assembly factor-like uncharacterized protein
LVLHAVLAFITLAFAVLPAAAQEEEALEDRWRYFYEMRAYPFERVPAGALQRARQQFAARWPDALARNAANDIAVGSSVWTPIGPAPIEGGFSGRIASIAVHPTNPAILYIGAAQGGVWKSIDGGASWVPLTDTQCSLAMGSIAIDPVNPQILYAGTGELHFSGDSYYGCGILRSIDGGASWTQMGASVFDFTTGGARVSRVAIDPTSAGSAGSTLVYAATSSGLFRSTNSGLTWTQTLAGIATDVVIDPVDPRILYSAIGATSGSNQNGVYKSTDRGATWTPLTSGFPGGNTGRIALAIAPSSPSTVYAAIQDAFGGGGSDGQLLGIYRTIDAGATWARLAASGADCASQCWYDLFLAVDPLDAAVVYFGGVLLYRSDDGGALFRNITRSIHVDQHTIAFDPTNPSTVFVGNDGGIFRTQNRGGSWTSLNTNLAITQFYAGVSAHPLDPNVVLGGTQDNGTLEFGGTTTWAVALGGDGGYTAIDYIDPTRAWAETQWSPNSGFSGPRLRIGAAGFGPPMVTGINTAEPALFIPPLVMDPVNPDILYFGTIRLYRTTNSGNLWTSLTNDLSKGTGRVSSIAPAPSDPSVVYVGTNDGNVHVTRDSGATFTLRITGLPNRAVTDIAVDGDDAATATLTMSGFGTGHVFRTTDYGVTWSDASGNLPDLPVNAALTHPGLGTDLYVGTDLGIFRSTNSGGSWTPFNPGLPNVAVFDLIYSSTTGIAVAATHGRGVFAFRPVVAASLVVAPDTIAFTSLEDSVHVSATAFDSTGTAIGGASFAWRSLDPAVATVDATGTVVSRGNGTTRIIASFAGVSDSTTVRVQQIVVALVGLPDSLTLVAGERVSPPVRAVDAAGQTALNAIVQFASSDPAVAIVDATGTITAVSIGTTVVRATVGSLRDSAFVRVAPPSVTDVAAQPIPSTNTATTAAGTRLPLLKLQFTVNGIEPVELTRLGFEVTGNDPGATLILVDDVNHDGIADPTEPTVASFPVSLVEDATKQVTLSPDGLELQPGQTTDLIAALSLSGRSPNGATFSLAFLPQLTSSIGTRSGIRDRLDLPADIVASADVTTSLLQPGQLLSFSENPVRSASVIFNFAETPTAAAIYTLTGRRIVDLAQRISGTGRVEWDLRNDEGTSVAPGVYLVIFNVQGTVLRERLIVLRPREPDRPPSGTVRRQPAGRS